MMKLWLIFAAILAFVALSTATEQEQPVEHLEKRVSYIPCRYRPGCMSIFGGVAHEPQKPPCLQSEGCQSTVGILDEAQSTRAPLKIPEQEDNPREGDLQTPRTSRTTQRQKNRLAIYRIGSLSALSRGLMSNLSTLEVEGEENIQRQERGASSIRDPCWGCCGTQFPKHTGKREPSKGDTGPLGATPAPEQPRRNGTDGGRRPGAYTPLGKMERPDRPLGGGQAGSFLGIKWNSSSRDGKGTADRCQGCCGASNATAEAKVPRRMEEGREGSQSSEGRPSKKPWRPQASSFPGGKERRGSLSPEGHLSSTREDHDPQKAK